MDDAAALPASWLTKIVMALGLLVDAGLVTLFIAISGFVFGGPEGARGEASAVAEWSLAVVICVLGPILGLVMWRRGRRDLALAATWLPPLALLVGATMT